jgi:hypothetical protein
MTMHVVDTTIRGETRERPVLAKIIVFQIFVFRSGKDDEMPVCKYGP